MLISTTLALLSVAALPANSLPASSLHTVQRRQNDYSCTSSSNPVILIHGLGANDVDDLGPLDLYLQDQGFCTFSLTYGAYDQWPDIGGLKPIAESSPIIASFIRDVQSHYGGKVDIVGHSEGGFMTLYVPKVEGISSIADKLVAIAPPAHGTTAMDLYTLAEAFGDTAKETIEDILNTVGCGACTDLLPDGGAVARLNDGPIVQSGNSLTVITSNVDEVVTPPGDAAFVNEAGVRNVYVQQDCPNDYVGHVGEAFDTNVWHLVVNALNDTPDRTYDCSYGAPFRTR